MNACNSQLRHFWPSFWSSGETSVKHMGSPCELGIGALGRFCDSIIGRVSLGSLSCIAEMLTLGRIPVPFQCPSNKGGDALQFEPERIWCSLICDSRSCILKSCQASWICCRSAYLPTYFLWYSNQLVHVSWFYHFYDPAFVPRN